MEKIQSLVTARPAAGARALILFAAFVSFVLSVALWFSGDRQRGIFGTLVTLIVAAAIALLVYAAVLDGRYAKAYAPAAEPPEPAAVPDAMGMASAGQATAA